MMMIPKLKAFEQLLKVLEDNRRSVEHFDNFGFIGLRLLFTKSEQVKVNKDLLKNKQDLAKEILPWLDAEGELQGLTEYQDKISLYAKFWEGERLWVEEQRKKIKMLTKSIFLDRYERFASEELKKLEGTTSVPSAFDSLFNNDDDKKFVLLYLHKEKIIDTDNTFITVKSKTRASRKTRLKAVIMVFKDKLFGGIPELELTPIICNFIGCKYPKSNRLSRNDDGAYKIFKSEVEKHTELYLNDKEDFFEKHRKTQENTERRN